MLDKLHQRMRKVEALFLGATTPGKRAAAGNILQRLRARIAELQSSNGSGSTPFGNRAKRRRPRQTRGQGAAGQVERQRRSQGAAGG